MSVLINEGGFRSLQFKLTLEDLTINEDCIEDMLKEIKQKSNLQIKFVLNKECTLLALSVNGNLAIPEYVLQECTEKGLSLVSCKRAEIKKVCVN